ncbi:MAG: TetR/AcrR family transcriptional regulator [Microscillaceae bacterium]|nr:TetR/AcrR family transcriptional regulator [Microscillaceae bacterium]
MKTETKTEVKKNDILRVARECFARYGFEKTTLDDIGRMAHLNKASLYYYFKNKEEIFMQVVLQESATFIGHLQMENQALQGAKNRILAYLSARLKYYDEVVNLHQLSVESLQKLGPQFDEFYHNVQKEEKEFLAQILQQGVANQEFSLHNSPEIAEAIMTVANAIKHEAYYNSKAFTVREVDYSDADQKITFIVGLILQAIDKK